jgi:hypothetical protein
VSTSQLIRYGAIGAAALAIVAGAVYLLERGMAPSAEQQTANPAAPHPSANPTASPTANATANPPSADDQAGPSTVQNDQLLSLVGAARRLAPAGKFDEADAELQKADKVYKGWSETETARNDIAKLRTPEGQLKTQLDRARLAIEHDDKATAETALAEAERLNPQEPQIASLRQQLKDANQKQERHNSRLTDLLAKMREDIARGDLAAADGELNAAERLDVQDPAIRDARRELARAREAKEKAQK